MSFRLGDKLMSLTHRCPGRNPSEFPDAPTVFVVDDDPSVRQALGPLLRSAGYHPRTAASAEEFLARPRPRSPSCLLTELRLPGLTGLELQRLVLGRKELPVIVMSDRIDVQIAVQAMKAGALEVLTKPLVPDVLLNTIRHALERSRAALEHLARIQLLRDRYASLSAREREVMSLLVSGRLNKQVGGDLGIAEYTVKAHRGRLMRKMHAG